MIKVSLLPEKTVADYKFNKIEIVKLSIGDFFYHKGLVWVITNFNYRGSQVLAIALSRGTVYGFEYDVVVDVPREIDLRIERI